MVWWFPGAVLEVGGEGHQFSGPHPYFDAYDAGVCACVGAGVFVWELVALVRLVKGKPKGKRISWEGRVQNVKKKTHSPGNRFV